MQGHQLASVVVLALAISAISAGCGSDETQSTTATGGSPSGSGGNGGGAPSDGGSGGGVGNAGGSGGSGGSGGAQGSGGSATIDLSELGTPCSGGQCPPGLSPIESCGIAGCDVTSFCTCELPCAGDAEACPAGTVCAAVSDGPGEVCILN